MVFIRFDVLLQVAGDAGSDRQESLILSIRANPIPEINEAMLGIIEKYTYVSDWKVSNLNVFKSCLYWEGD